MVKSAGSAGPAELDGIGSAGPAELDGARSAGPAELDGTGSARPAELDRAGSIRSTDTARPEWAGQSRFRDFMVRMETTNTEGNGIIEDK